MTTAEDQIPELEVKTNVMLRILGDDLDPESCTKALGIQPTSAYAKGDSYDIPSVGSRQRSTGLWSLSSEGQVTSDDPVAHLRYIVETFRASRTHLAAIASHEGVRVSCCIWWESSDSHGGFTVPSDLLVEAGHLCEDMQFQFIGGDDE